MTARPNRFVAGSTEIQGAVVAAEFPAPEMDSLFGAQKFPDRAPAGNCPQGLGIAL
jgi:hypothetical protein